ncbi:chemotaxis protein methyltransferase [Blastomonas marina]|uniref:Chemotaxis protein methyltransferase n=1 Tax=Blastomonas marina TaxID=1867408 RepID=A0ABQ1F2W1_9SPHN|nr:CheR family methyltransferase [Blastomonas marina]GFZ97675.1 chemotaxis protein methyltransferase [Blastomonas marina]
MTNLSEQIIADLLLEYTGQELTDSRRWRIGSALSGLFRERGLDNVEQLVVLLSEQRDNVLAKETVDALLNNETYFFRDKPMFDQLENDVLPRIAKQNEKQKRISIWSAGCSTGQEALTLAMMFADQPMRWKGWTIDILATDVSNKAIKAARNARYTQFEIQRGLGVGQMLQHFEETSQGWQPDRAIRDMITFQQHNILEPMVRATRFDLVLCRNVLLYFCADTRRRAFDRLVEAMAPDGWLMLGAGETSVGHTDAFIPARKLPGLYRPFEAAEATEEQEGTNLAAAR